MNPKSFLYGFIACALCVGCAGAVFPYRNYGLAGLGYENGTLLGPDIHGKDDLPFLACEPTASTRNPCTVMFADAFYRMKQDYLDTKEKLSDCERKLE